MKRICSICLLILMLSVTAGGCGISGRQQSDVRNLGIGVIETNGSIESSQITFYDDNLNLQMTLALNYATINGIFYNPLVYNGDLYIIPQGYANFKDEKKALKIRLSNLEKKEYKIDQIAMNSIAVDETNIYTCNNLNGDSYINKCNKESGQVETIKIKHVYISLLLFHRGALYAFGTTPEDQSYLYRYSSNLQLISTVDISGYGCDIYKAVAYGDTIFITDRGRTVSAYSIKDKKAETIELDQGYALDMVIHNHVLIVSHFDLVRLEGGGISFYDLNTKEKKYYDLEHGAEQIALKGDFLYVMSEPRVYQYRIVDMGLELVKETEVKKRNKDNYFSGIFAIGG